MSTVVADRAASFMSGARDRSVVTPAATVVRRGRGDDTTVGRRTGSARTIVWAGAPNGVSKDDCVGDLTTADVAMWYVRLVVPVCVVSHIAFCIIGWCMYRTNGRIARTC